jgi:hypothetical protein
MSGKSARFPLGNSAHHNTRVDCVGGTEPKKLAGVLRVSDKRSALCYSRAVPLFDHGLPGAGMTLQWERLHGAVSASPGSSGEAWSPAGGS